MPIPVDSIRTFTYEQEPALRHLAQLVLKILQEPPAHAYTAREIVHAILSKMGMPDAWLPWFVRAELVLEALGIVSPDVAEFNRNGKQFVDIVLNAMIEAGDLRVTVREGEIYLHPIAASMRLAEPSGPFWLS